jgi:hypothetical protein
MRDYKLNSEMPWIVAWRYMTDHAGTFDEYFLKNPDEEFRA